MSTSPSSSAPFTLVGRDRELSVLRENLNAALTGRGSLLLIGGEAGIGKTALAETICREASEQGALVLVGRCFDLSETPPYGPWVELFGRHPPENDLPLPAAFAQRGTVGEVASQAMLFQQVKDFLAALAMKRPLVLVLDDLHWTDPASLDLLRLIARSLTTLPLLIIVTYRSDELTRRHPLYALLPALVRESHAIRLGLRPLTENDLRALMGTGYRLDPADTSRLIAYLQERGEGNPFFLGELLRTLEEEGALRATDDGWMLGDLARVRVPSLLRQVIDGRLARLGEEARTLLGVAAVIGQEVPLTLWSAVTGSDDEALLPIIERSVEVSLLTETPDGTQVRFVHALIREALYEGMLATRRRTCHRQVAEILSRLPAPDPDAVAYHFRQAGDTHAAKWLIAAGERAQKAYAWQTATERFEAALGAMEASDETLASRGWLLYRLAIVCRYDNLPKAIAYEDEAARVAENVGDRSLAAAALFCRGWLRMFDGELTEAETLLTSGNEALETLSAAELDRIKQADDLGSNMFAETGRGALMQFFAMTGRYAEVQKLRERYFATLPLFKSADAWAASTIGNVFTSLGQMHVMLGYPMEARDAFKRARAAFRTTSHQVMVAWAATYELEMVMLPCYADRPTECERIAAEVENAWRRLGDIGYIFSPRLARTPLLIVEGNWTEARELVRPASANAHFEIRALATRAAAHLAYAQGEPDSAWDLIHAALPAGTATEPGSTHFFTALTLQRVAIALSLDAGDLAVARQWLEAHDGLIAWGGIILGQAERDHLHARYYRTLGDATSAHQHASRAYSHANAPRQPLALIAAHRLLGELDTDARRYGEAETHLAESLALADACAARYERALTLLAMAELKTATGEHDAALALLAEVRTICEPLGATPALARADALASRLTGDARPATAYPAGLSAREVEVLRLVAQGLTNPQVAEQLFLSPRTVQQHLRSIYNKVGVSTRAAAARWAAEHALA